LFDRPKPVVAVVPMEEGEEDINQQHETKYLFFVSNRFCEGRGEGGTWLNQAQRGAQKKKQGAETHCDCRLVCLDVDKGAVPCLFEYCNKPCGSIKCGQFLDHLGEYQLPERLASRSCNELNSHETLV
jgi:hypothetical protein